MDPQQDPLSSPDLGPSLPAKAAATGDVTGEGWVPGWSNPLTNGSPLSKLVDKLPAPQMGGAPTVYSWAKGAGAPPPPSPPPAADQSPNFSGPNGPVYVPPGAQQPAPAGAPVQQPPPPPSKPVTAEQHQALQKIGKKAEDSIGPDGLINTEQIKNDLAQIGLDDKQKALALKAVNDANDHIRVASAIGAQQARDATGADFWENANTGLKILRVLGGIVTLGGSEKVIHRIIDSRVARDQADMAGEDNIYKTMVDAGKTREQALSIDYAKQAHIYTLGLDRIAAQHPSPVVQDRIAAMKAGMQKDTSTALAAFYKQQQDNKIAQQNANSASMNAQTDRMKLGVEQKKGVAARTVRDENGDPVGVADSDKSKEHLDALGIAMSQMRRAKFQMDRMVLEGSRLSPADTLSMENAKKGFIEGLSADIDSGKIIPSSRTKEMIDRFSNSHFSLWSTQRTEAGKILKATADDYAEQKRRAGIKN